jgi:hypothetical protein
MNFEYTYKVQKNLLGMHKRLTEIAAVFNPMSHLSTIILK